MKKVLLLLCICAALLAPAFSQTKTPPTAPNAENSASKSAGADDEENFIDWLWKRSDEAFHAGDYPRAIGLHKAIVALDPHDVESYNVAAWLMWSLGDGDAAQQHIERGAKANPDNWEMWDVAGQQCDLQKYFSKAQAAYQNAAKLIPHDADSQMLRRRLAHAAENAGDLQTARKTWQQLVKDYPNDAVNKNNLVRVEKKIKSGKTLAEKVLLSWQNSFI